MLMSQGIPLEGLGVPTADGTRVEADPRAAWRLFAEHYYLFRGTPSKLWLDWVLGEVFGIGEQLDTQSADAIYDLIGQALVTDGYRPRALFDRFGIEVLATTESPLDSLDQHQAIRASGWGGRIITTYRPDPVIDPDAPGFAANLAELADLTGEDVGSFAGYLRAHPSALTADLPLTDAEALYARILRGRGEAGDAELFRGQMLTEMARMSLDDGMVMQLHAGVYRNHNPQVLARFGRDKGADIPVAGEFVRGLKPLLDAVGNEPALTLILFTLDEDVYARELAPLAGHYPALRIGPPWWFHDSPEGMRRFRERVTETAGFYNTAGFNDDTRAFLSIPARHDVARRMDCGFLARLVAEHRLDEDEAHEVAHDLAYGLAKRTYRL